MDSTSKRTKVISGEASATSLARTDSVMRLLTTAATDKVMVEVSQQSAARAMEAVRCLTGVVATLSRPNEKMISITPDVDGVVATRAQEAIEGLARHAVTENELRDNIIALAEIASLKGLLAGTRESYGKVSSQFRVFREGTAKHIAAVAEATSART